MKGPYKGEDGLWRVDDVPMISTGIEYPLASGPATFTDDDLKDVVASQEDPAIVSPRIKLGHSSGYNEMLIGDAEQAFGRWENLRLGNNGQTIYGDMVGMPEWLAQVVPVAYPNRSIEGNFDVQMVTGKQYKMIVSACVLLGVRWPGCQVLEDLPLFYGSSIPPGVEIDQEIDQEGEMGIAASGVDAAVDVSQIRRKFYKAASDGELDVPEGVNTYWWWPRGEKFDASGMFLIVDDEENGDLYRVPVTVSNDEVTFGTATLVVEEFPEKTAAARAAVVAGMAISDPKIVVHASRAETAGPVKATQEGASVMDEATRKIIAQRLGLPEDATEAQIDSHIAQLRAAADDEENGQRGAADRAPAADEHGTTGPNRGENREQGMPTGAGPATTPPPDPGDPDDDDDPDAEATVRLDRDTYRRLKAGADAGLRLAAEADKQKVEDILSSAIQAGKFAPARKEHYRQLLASDFEGGKQLIESLQAGIIPTRERGTAGSSEEGVSGEDNSGFPLDWFPEIAASRNRGPIGLVTQAREG